MADVKVNYNERSWAIEMITQINFIAENNDLIIKRAGGGVYGFCKPTTSYVP